MSVDIKKKVRTLLSNHNIAEPHVPVEKIARNEGIAVHFVSLEDELSGMALIDKGGQANIIINANHHPNRQRFSLAHELGHHKLHLDLLEGEKVHVDTVVLRRDKEATEGIYRKEIEANRFAAELLMPEAMLSIYDASKIDLGDDKSIKRLAKIFKVSAAAMSFRLGNLL